MVAKWRVTLRVAVPEAVSEAASLGIDAKLDRQDDGTGTVVLRVEGPIPGVMELADRWDVAPKDVLAFWH